MVIFNAIEHKDQEDLAAEGGNLGALAAQAETLVKVGDTGACRIELGCNSNSDKRNLIVYKIGLFRILTCSGCACV